MNQLEPGSPAWMQRQRRNLFIALGLVAVVVVGIGVLAAFSEPGPWSGDGSSLAQRACGDARLALEEMVDRTRTIESTKAALANASDDARSAASLNRKWLPLARSITGAHAELEASTPGADTRSLLKNCGMPDQ